MKRLTLVTAMLLGCGVGCCAAFAADPPPKPGAVELQVEFRWGAFTADNPIKQFSNIPASYRTVPWHPDDDHGEGRTATIADGTLNPTNIRALHYLPAVGLTFYDRLTLRMGFDFQPVHETKVGTGNDGIIRETEIHSYTYSRLVGDSLVYYAIPRPSWGAQPILMPEAEIRIWRQFGILAGAWRRGFTYNIQRGYDRYSAMQKLDDTPFADVQVANPYLGIRLAWADRDDDFRPYFGMVFRVGPMELKPILRPQAQGVTYIQEPRGLMYSLEFCLGGVARKFGKHSSLIH